MNNTINTNDFVSCPYNDHSSPPLLPTFSFSPSFNGILNNPNTTPSDDHYHRHDLDHHNYLHDLLEYSSPSPQFEFDPESLYAVFLRPNNDHDDNVNRHHHQPSLDLLPLNNNNTVKGQSVDASETITRMEDYSKKVSNCPHPAARANPKKRTSKTDRHSKIYTAKGPRDRRMRLSLEVAREFFGLQDMLGFDKASKTVEWLLTQAKSEIKKLSRSLPMRFNHGLISSEDSQTLASGWIGESGSKMNTGTCRRASSSVVFPWTDDTWADPYEVASASTNEIDVKSGKEKKKKKRSQSRNPIFRKLPKDARTKARERAKERTKEKMMMRQRSSSEAVVHTKNSEVNDHLGTSSNWSSFETGEDSVQEIKEPSPSNRFVACNNFGMDQEDGIRQESLDVINKWNPFSIFNYHQNQGSASSMENQYMDHHHHHQPLGKPRSAFYDS